MNNYRYTIWKEKPTSRPALLMTDDDGRTFNKVAVFRNEECVKVFGKWLAGVLREYSDMLFNNIAEDADNRLARLIGGTDNETD